MTRDLPKFLDSCFVHVLRIVAQLVIHLSLSDNPLDPQLLRNNYSRLFPNDQRSRVRVRGDVTRTDGQVCNLESLDAIKIQT